MTRTAVAITCVTAAASLSAMLAGPASAAPSSHTQVIAACRAPAYRPTHYVMTCADGNTQIRHVTYSSWSSSAATARGTYVYNTCRPDCAAGTFKHHPVTFSLDRVRTVHGTRLFTRMLVSYAGLTETFGLPTSGI
jgi:hypothetical protein